MKIENKKFQDQLKQKENEVTNLNKLLETKEELLKTKEEKLNLMKLVEGELKKTQMRKKKDKENLKQYYENEFLSSSKEISNLQKMTTANLSDTDKLRFFQKEILAYKDVNIKKMQNIESILKNLSASSDDLNIYDAEHFNSSHTLDGHIATIASSKAIEKQLNERPSSSLKMKSRYHSELHTSK